jgi:ABC-type glycerol-3-phosphate transport system permease component
LSLCLRSLAAWNSFFNALIFIQHKEQFTLSLGLQVFSATADRMESADGSIAADSRAVLVCSL